ncbi:MAG: hypothetical protein KDC82_00085 [Bacteroidetes bacterium]|nr:hypothetical protein [Bacteroidota bacterium]
MQVQTASESGLVPESTFTKLSGLAVGSEVIVIAMPEYSEHEKFGVQASILTQNLGTVQTNNAKTIGSLRSDNPKSLGGIIAANLEKDIATKLFVREEEANTGRKQKFLSVY